jgi:hypothetical protein
VLAVGKCASSAGLMVTEGIGWKPSSLAGRAGEPVQKYTCNRISTSLNHTASPSYQILSLQMRHLLHYGPEPPLELDQALAVLARLVVERRVRNQHRHVYVADAVQQKAQVFGGEAVERTLGEDVQDSGADALQQHDTSGDPAPLFRALLTSIAFS